MRITIFDHVMNLKSAGQQWLPVHSNSIPVLASTRETPVYHNIADGGLPCVDVVLPETLEVGDQDEIRSLVSLGYHASVIKITDGMVIRFYRNSDFRCVEHPENLVFQPLGQYRCPYCGEMVMAGLTHIFGDDYDTVHS